MDILIALSKWIAKSDHLLLVLTYFTWTISINVLTTFKKGLSRINEHFLNIYQNISGMKFARKTPAIAKNPRL